jgi:MFS transporter, DHA1 family, multidrug resistance protein
LSHLGITVLLASLSMIGPLGIDAYLPSFHAIGREFAADPLVVQQTLSAYVLCFAVMTLFYGTLSDSFGRRPVILVALVLFMIGSVAAALAPSVGWLIVARGFQGLAAGAGMVIGRAVVQDRFSGAAAHRVMAHMMMVFGLAPAIAPVIGGWLQSVYGWRSVFVFLTLATLAMFVACYVCLTESLPVAKRQPFRLRTIAANYVTVLKNPQFLTMAVSLGFVFMGISLYIGSAANFVMDMLHLPETAFAWMFVPLVGGMMSGSALAPRLLARTSPALVIRIGFAIMITAGLLNVAYNTWFVAAVPWAVLPIALYSFGIAFATPGVTLQILAIFPTLRGMAASVQSFIQMLIFAIVAGLVSPLLSGSPLHLAAGHLAGAVIASGLWLLANRKRPQR